MEFRYFLLVLLMLAIMQGIAQPYFNTIYEGKGYREGARHTRSVMAKHFPVCIPKIKED